MREESQLWRKYQPELLGEDDHEPFTEVRPLTDEKIEFVNNLRALAMLSTQNKFVATAH